ncbi:MAG TPA: SUMF1/EgtB/PvdO family nonheme iron enzyme [Labilithrix sp.]|nr:SUMF1/EgtB/PvdO family nonheme iron enzyme [Labilithrix sp.]
MSSSTTARFVIAGLVGAVMLANAGSANSLDSGRSAPRHAASTRATIAERSLRKTARACPRNMALVGATCVDRYESSLVEIHADGRETPFSPYLSPKRRRVRAVSRPGVVPQAYISMIDAKHACAASGKRLCRASEWTAACKGPSRTRYPYGNTRVPKACVDTHRASPMIVLHHGVCSGRTLNDPRANQQKNTVERTGIAAACTNAYGVHDMVGNLHEWTSDGSFRGGYYLDTRRNGEGCDYRTAAHAPSYHDYSTGFRCCADAASGLRDDD